MEATERLLTMTTTPDVIVQENSTLSVPPVAVPVRNVAVDVYRGFVMLLMMAEVLRFSQVAEAYPQSTFWKFLSFNQTHVEWVGCSLHDTIQPGFSFLVGVALPYSLASRASKGQSFGTQLAHCIWRAFILIILGIFLRSTNQPRTYFTFEDTLTQIGLGYVFLFLLGFARDRWLWITLAAILFVYWLAWALYPVAGPAFDWQAVGVPSNWSHNFSGFQAHWNKNANLGNRFDQWFLNLFPRTTPFVANDGGYLTLVLFPPSAL
jgi:predicted acyltransferase